MSNSCIVLLEKEWCKFNYATLDSFGNLTTDLVTKTWIPQRYIDSDGQRLFEEIDRQIINKTPENFEIDSIIISMPGTIINRSIVKSSSRIGIKHQVDAANIIYSSQHVPVSIIHDMDCMLIGAYKEAIDTHQAKNQTLCYILVDEGVGSTFLINGKIHHGAGIAGHISRLVVEKNGEFDKELNNSGILEQYVSRPELSRRCIDEFKKNIEWGKENQGDEKFRRKLRGLMNENPKGLKFEDIARGYSNDDEIAKKVLNLATGYLAQAVNSIITIVHPHSIILAGGLITLIPDFYTKVLEETEKLSWPNAWKNVSFSMHDNSRNDQLVGALYMATLNNGIEVI